MPVPFFTTLIAPAPIIPEKVVEVLLLPAVRLGLPLHVVMVPLPDKLPAVMEKPASCSVPVTVKAPVCVTDPVSVTVWPLAMITSSVDKGTTPPTQVLPELQFPEVFEVMVAPKELCAYNIKDKTASSVRRRDQFRRLYSGTVRCL